MFSKFLIENGWFRVDLEGMTGENAEPYFTFADILPKLNHLLSKLAVLVQTVNFSASWHQFM